MAIGNSSIVSIYPYLKAFTNDDTDPNNGCYGFVIFHPDNTKTIKLKINNDAYVTLNNTNYGTPHNINAYIYISTSELPTNGNFTVYVQGEQYAIGGEYYSSTGFSDGAVYLCGTKEFFYTDANAYSGLFCKTVTLKDLQLSTIASAVYDGGYSQNSISGCTSWYYRFPPNINSGTYRIVQEESYNCDSNVDFVFSPFYTINAQNCDFNKPNIISYKENICPSNTVDLSLIVPTNTVTDYSLTWHSGIIATDSNKLTNLNVGENTYYAAFYNSLLDIYSVTTPISIHIISCSSATLIDDVNTTPMNTIVTGSVTGNDTVNCTGTKTYRIKTGSQVNGTFTIDNSGNYNFTPDNNFIGLATAKYEVLCDGIVLGEANINITVTCVAISGGIINGVSNVDINVNYTYNITGLSGTLLYTYLWSGGTIVSGQGTDTVIVKNATNLQCIISNCNNSTITLTKEVNIKTGCTLTIYFKYNCGDISELNITKENTQEINRLISYNLNTGDLKFTADIGLFNYLLKFKINNLNNSILFKNILC